MGIWAKGTLVILSIFVLATFGFSQDAFAATVTWDGNSDGDGGDGVNWFDPLNWNTTVPAPGDDVIIPLGFTVSVNSNILSPNEPNSITNSGTLIINQQRTLTIANALRNDGVVQMPTLNAVTLLFSGLNPTISGSGEIQMTGSSISRISATTPGVTLTNDVGHTIRVSTSNEARLPGTVGGLINNGNIIVVAGLLTLDPGPGTNFQNNGRMEAIGSSEIRWQGAGDTFIQNGQLISDNALISLRNASTLQDNSLGLSTPTFESVNGGRIEVRTNFATVVFDNVVIPNGVTLDIQQSSAVEVVVNLHNDGIIRMITLNAVTLQFRDDATWTTTGTGQVWMFGNGPASIGQVGTFLNPLTHPAGHKISVINNGNARFMQANNGQVLGGMINLGIIEVTSGTLT